MNREIKFRAWFPETKIMLDFDQYHFCYEYGSLSWDLDEGNEYGGIACGPEDYDQAIIMQFTSLYDKNNNPIYEGDIVKFHDHPTGLEDGVGEVYWKDGMWKVAWAMEALGSFGTAWTEVLGNKFENPELLTT